MLNSPRDTSINYKKCQQQQQNRMRTAVESSFSNSGIARDSLLLSHVLCPPSSSTALCAKRGL